MAVGGPLFGSSSGGRSQAKSSLVEFKAGKMTFNTSTKMVSPDKRKGMLMVTQSDDQLMHLQWKDRGTGTIEVCWRFSAIMILIPSQPPGRPDHLP